MSRARNTRAATGNPPRDPLTATSAQGLNSTDLNRIAAQPGNRVLQWAEPGDRRESAFSAAGLLEVVEALKRAVVKTVAETPGTNEFMLRFKLGAKPVAVSGSGSGSSSFPSLSLPDGYTWGHFAEHYPTFWSKLTAAASTRKDVVAIHAMIAARMRFEAGELREEKEVDAQIQSDLIALNMEDGAKIERHGRGRNDTEVRRMVEQARLRREVLHRAFRAVMVPTEELARRGVPFEPAVSCLHKIVEADAAMEKKLKIKRYADARKANIRQLNRVGVTLARSLLQLRVAMAKECMGLPESLDPVGATFMPTYTRSAQVDCRWEGGMGGADWVGLPGIAEP